jgi:hypothetical protein
MNPGYTRKVEENGDIVWKFNFTGSERTDKPNGTKVWRNCKGQIHKEGYPAIKSNDGIKIWMKENLHHRIGGFAVEYPPKGETGEYWVNGEQKTKEEYNEEIMPYNLY